MRFRHQLTIFAILFTLSVDGQETPIYSQYILNEFLLNPSRAGYDGMTSINLTGRKQWLGLKYSPETYSASVSSRILKSPFKVKGRKVKKGSGGRVGLGLVATSDKNGAIQKTSIEGTYAYHIFLNNTQLSFGSSFTLTQLSIDKNLVDLKGGVDPVEDYLGQSSTIPDAKLGISFESKNYCVGVSVFNLLESALHFGEIEFQKKDLKEQRIYNFIGMYRAPLSGQEWEIEPSTVIRFDEQFHFSADFSTRFIYDNQYWGGMSFRTSGEIVLLAGLKMSRFYFGYSFDYGFNQLSRLSYGSHEITLALKLGDSTRRYRWHERY